MTTVAICLAIPQRMRQSGHRYGDMVVWSPSRKALPGTEVGRRSVLNITLISYTPLRYIKNVAKRSEK